MDFQSSTEIHYPHHPQQTQQHPHQQQPQQTQQQSWNQSTTPLNTLLQPPQSSALAPAQDHHHHQQQQLYHHYPTPVSTESRPQNSTSLSLNISGLSVASPTNLSPITPSTHQSTNSAVSPITPISPAQQALSGGGPGTHLHHHHHPAIHPFQFVPTPHDHRYDDQPTVSVPFDYSRRLNSSRSSSSDEKSIPRKRSFTTNATMLEDHLYEAADVDIHTPNGSLYDDMDISYTNAVSGSPADGGSNSGGEEDPLKPISQSSSLSGKPITTNNFVTKLYQYVVSLSGSFLDSERPAPRMIIDPKSAQFITWTELGTSFVVSNVAEFSRTILGSHFKHNNVSTSFRP